MVQILPAMLRSGFSEEQCSDIFQDLILDVRLPSSEENLTRENGKSVAGTSEDVIQEEEKEITEQSHHTRPDALRHNSPIIQQLAVIDGKSARNIERDMPQSYRVRKRVKEIACV